MEDKKIKEILIDAKKSFLRAKMYILGFNSTAELHGDLDGSKGYRALGRIGRDLEHFGEKKDFQGNFYQKSKMEAQKYLEETQADYDFIEKQNEFWSRIRKIYPDFGLHMNQKISPEDWEHYSEITKKTGFLLRDLVKGSKGRNLTKSSSLTREDEISELIDSQEFAQACKIEDEFMIEEFKKFREIVSKREFTDKESKDIAALAELAMLIRECDSISEEREKKVELYDKYDKFLSQIKETVTIRVGAPHKKSDREDDERE